MQDGFDRKRQQRHQQDASRFDTKNQRGSHSRSNSSRRNEREIDTVSLRSSYSSNSGSRDRSRFDSPSNSQRPESQPTDRYRDRDRYRTSSNRSAPAATNQRSNTPRRSDSPSQGAYVPYDSNPVQKRKIPKPLIIVIVAIVLIGVGVGGFAYAQSLPISLTINGTEQKLGGSKNIEAILSEQLATPRPGNLVAIDGGVLRAGDGERLYATVNGQETNNYAEKLSNDDHVVIENGADIIEPSQEATAEIPFETIEKGFGPITLLQTKGENGIVSTKTGSISGKTITEETRPKQDQVFLKYYPNVGTDKVVALTFDDGPWGDQTLQLMDVLAANNAKATFFVVGERIVDDGVDIVKRLNDSGHQVATHTYGHARNGGGSVNMGQMTPEAQIADLTEGYASIKNATGEEPSHVFRSPGGNFSLDSAKILAPYVNAEIRWNVDTEDWRKPGVDVIVEHITTAKPGSIILAHDGGGKRGDTIEALKKALPILKEKGYRFITIDELLQYPTT